MPATQLIFSVLSIVLTLAGLAAAYIYFRKSRKYKELSYEILPTLSLLSVGAEIRDRVEIRYKHGDGETEDLAIEDLKAVAITLHNTGTEAVNCKSSDFQEHDPQTPVTLDFGPQARILGEPSAETQPEGRKVRVKRAPEAPGRVLMDTFLLNPKETVTISTFLTNFFNTNLSVDWHIEGVRPPRELKRDSGNTWKQLSWVTVSLVIVVIILLAVGLLLSAPL